MQGLFGHCPNGGGVSTLAQMVWGTYFEKNCPCSKGHLLGLGGLNPCQDGLGHLCSENWSSNGICSSRSGNKVPQSARLSEGGGGQSLFGQCPNRPDIFQTGASLSVGSYIDQSALNKLLLGGNIQNNISLWSSAATRQLVIIFSLPNHSKWWNRTRFVFLFPTGLLRDVTASSNWGRLL